MYWKNAYPETPRLVVNPPGPKAASLIASEKAVSSPSYTRFYPLAVARGLGPVIEDVDGNVFLDFTAGIAVCSTGHCHPRIVEAIRRQAGELIHMSGTDFYYGPQRDLAVKLAELAPGPAPKRVFFGNSGAEAVEAALKLARYHTRRPNVIAFHGAFHGRTMGALSLTGSKATQRRGFEPLLAGVTHVEYPNGFHHPNHLKPETCAGACLDQIEQLFRRLIAPDTVAAVFVEPIQGEGGYLVPPPDFHPRLFELCHKHGILYVADEVQAGMGRTGRMFASEHWGVEPDIMCLAKGIATGMPLGAIVARADIMNWPPGAHASTFGGNPIACAAALETIALLEEELIANAAEVGDYLMARLRDLAQRHSLIGEVRGKGLMIGVELVADQASRRPAVHERDAVIERCFQRGLLVLGCGESAIRLCPPLVIGREEADIAVSIIDAAISDHSPPRRSGVAIEPLVSPMAGYHPETSNSMP